MVLVEAMAAGRPVVASRAGSIPEVVADGETGLLSEPGDATALAENLVRLLGDGPLRRRLGAAGRERVQTRFTVAGMASATWALYQDVLAAERRPS
jgi:glycosyltransferase involved in cell wall biosynthesis